MEMTTCNIIDWRITAMCNSNCEYCYASAQIKEMDDASLQKVIDEIILSGCKTVCISGGEPLLCSRVIPIMEQLHNAGISIYLSTNGTKYMEYREDLEKYISKLSLPLDGYDISSNSINGRFTVENNTQVEIFSAVKNILDYYEKHPHSFSIKIGTVFTKKSLSIDHFEQMLMFLRNYKIDIWKIYEFIPEARGCTNADDLCMDESDISTFMSQFDSLKKKFEQLNFDCVISTRAMRNSAYFIIQPDGTVMLPIDSTPKSVTEEIVGDLTKETFDSVIHKWLHKANKIKHTTNFETRNISRTLAKKHIDKIDKEIIYYLDQNPLQDCSEISEILKKKYLISKNDIKARIEKLYSIRAIRHIMPVINVSQFGLEVFLLNLFFKQTTSMDAGRIAEILCHDPHIAWVAECYEYNVTDDYVIFRIAILIENNNKLYERVKYLRNIFGETLYKYEVDTVPEKYICGQNFLLEKTDINRLNYDHITLDSSKQTLSAKEFAVISAMNSSERLSVDSISKISSLSKKQVVKVIDELVSKTVINKFQVVLDTNVLGYQCYLLFVKFKSYNDKDAFEEYVKKLPNVTHINTLNAGRWDIDVEIHVENSNTCANIWENIEKNFDNTIADKKMVRIKKDHKFKFLIDATLDAIESSVRKYVFLKKKKK